MYHSQYFNVATQCQCIWLIIIIGCQHICFHSITITNFELKSILAITPLGTNSECFHYLSTYFAIISVAICFIWLFILTIICLFILPRILENYLNFLNILINSWLTDQHHMILMIQFNEHNQWSFTLSINIFHIILFIFIALLWTLSIWIIIITITPFSINLLLNE